MIRKEGLALEFTDDELILLDKKSGQVHQLNSTATLVWRGLDERLSLEDIAAKLADMFQVELKATRNDVAKIIRQLQELSLLEVDDSDLTNESDH